MEPEDDVLDSGPEETGAPEAPESEPTGSSVHDPYLPEEDEPAEPEQQGQAEEQAQPQQQQEQRPQSSYLSDRMAEIEAITDLEQARRVAAQYLESQHRNYQLMRYAREERARAEQRADQLVTLLRSLPTQPQQPQGPQQGEEMAFEDDPAAFLQRTLDERVSASEQRILSTLEMQQVGQRLATYVERDAESFRQAHPDVDLSDVNRFVHQVLEQDALQQVNNDPRAVGLTSTERHQAAQALANQVANQAIQRAAAQGQSFIQHVFQLAQQYGYQVPQNGNGSGVPQMPQRPASGALDDVRRNARSGSGLPKGGKRNQAVPNLDLIRASDDDWADAVDRLARERGVDPEVIVKEELSRAASRR